MIELIFLIVIVVLLFKLVKSMGDAEKNESKENQQDDKSPVERVPWQYFDENKFLSRAKSYSEDTQRQIKKEMESHRNALSQNFSADIKMKESLSNFAKEHFLDETVISIWHEIDRKPPDQSFLGANLNITNYGVSSNVSEEGKIKKIGFDWNSMSYRIDLIEKERNFTVPSNGNSEEVEFKLFENNKEVFSFNATNLTDDYMGYYEARIITSFKTVGKWCELLFECRKVLEVEYQKRSEDWKYHNADKIKENFQA